MGKKPERSRGWFAQTSYYYATHDKDGNVTNNGTEQQWRDATVNRLKKIPNVEFGALIFHDKDVENGKIKGLHAHILIKFENPRARGGVAKDLQTTRDANLQTVRSYCQAARYLTHVSNKALNQGKVVYPQDEVIVFGKKPRPYTDLIKTSMDGSNRDDPDVRDFMDELGEAIQNGKTHISEVKREILAVYGQAEYRQFRNTFEDDWQEHVTEIMRDKAVNGRDLTTVFISGGGDLGKSVLAMNLAPKFTDDFGGVHSVAVQGKNKTFDMVSKYDNEKVTVINDLDSGCYDYREFLNIFDPYVYTPINSRNVDKHWLADTCFITCSTALETYITEMMYWSQGGLRFHDATADRRMMNGMKQFVETLNDEDETKDVFWQIRRRFKFYIRLELKDPKTVELNIYRVNNDKKTHDLVHTLTYPKIQNKQHGKTFMPDVAKKVYDVMMKHK